ncbi:MAG TPA: hypothetical protein VK626_01625 [Nitrospiraceae bacterium]|nr:hypothetical protein [Nitrospiraceae bacterium]
MKHAYMLPPKEQTHITESYVSSPPALLVVNEQGTVFTLGETFAQDSSAPWGEYAFNVLVNGQDSGEYASRIERRNGKVRIYGRQGFKTWNGRTFI